MAEVRLLYVDEPDAYVPVAIPGEKSLKNVWLVAVMVILPILFHWYSASYNCSAAAWFDIYL